MNLAIFLSFKESMEILKKSGQDERFIEYYLKPYSKEFEKIYVFGWKNENFAFGIDNVSLVPNKKINIYLYNFILPFKHSKILRECEAIRLMQFTAIIPAIISKIFNKNKIIATYGFPYGKFLKINKSYIKFFIWNTLEKALVKIVDKFIVTYENNKKFLIENGVKESKIFLSPNGVDIDIFSPQQNKQFNKNNIKILFVGRLEIQKNLENLALALGASKYAKNISLTILGRGSLEKKISGILTSKNVGFEIVSSISHKDTANYYKSADMFVLTSLTEGYPKVLIEALSCGLPCIVSKYKGHENIMADRENGIVCGFDAKDISEKIDLLISNDKLREKVSLGAREFAEKNNNIKKIVDREIKEILTLQTDTNSAN